MIKPPLDKGNPFFGHSIKFNNNALSLVKNLQEKYGDIFEISILHKRVTMFMTPSATKHIFLDAEDNFSSKHGWEFSLGKTFENGLMLRDFDDHRFHRGLLQDAFRRDALANYLEIVQPLLDTWIEELQESKSINLYSTMKELMFKISLQLFFDEVDTSRQKELEKLFTDAIKSATSVVRVPLPFTKLRRGLKARQSLLKYFENKAKNKVILHFNAKNAPNNTCYYQLTCRSIHLKVVVRVYFEWLNMRRKFRCSSCILGYVINQEKVCHFSKTKLKIRLYCISMRKTHLIAVVIAS